MDKYIYIGLAAIILGALLFSNFSDLSDLFSFERNDVEIKTRQLTDTYNTMWVEYSSPFNMKDDYGCSYAMIDGDTDLATNEDTCLKWQGGWSEAQQNCDIRTIATGSVISKNGLKFRDAVVLASVEGNTLKICLPDWNEVCTRVQYDNDQCTGEISGYITFYIPEDLTCTTDSQCVDKLKKCSADCRNGQCDIPSVGTNPPAPCASAVWQDYPTCAWDDSMCDTTVCGDGICSSTENAVNCPADCQVPPPPPVNPFQFLIDLWMGFVNWIKSLFGL